MSIIMCACAINGVTVMSSTSTFIECRGEPELIFVQFDNSIIKLIIKHQQYLSTDLFSRSFYSHVQ